MRKVYLLWKRGTDSGVLDSVWSTKEKADARLDEVGEGNAIAVTVATVNTTYMPYQGDEKITDEEEDSPDD